MSEGLRGVKCSWVGVCGFFDQLMNCHTHNR